MAELGEKPTSRPYIAAGKPGLGSGSGGSGYKVSNFFIFAYAFFIINCFQVMSA